MKVKSCIELLAERRNNDSRGVKLQFLNTNGKDAYNITSPFKIDGMEVIVARVEATDEEISDAKFFKKISENTYELIENAAVLHGQDPAYAFVQGKLVVSIVYVHTDENNNITNWDTRFYAGKDIYNLEYLTKGPLKMKDIRILELPDGRVGIFTRPCDIPDCHAKIGFTSVDTLEDINEQVIADATLFDYQFLNEEWGGANQAFVLKNGLIGVLGHVAYMTENDVRHYCSMVFTFNYKTGKYSPCEIIATRKNFPDGKYKGFMISDVVFSGGMVRNGDGTATLYAGISDCEAARLDIEDPFLKYEV